MGSRAAAMFNASRLDRVYYCFFIKSLSIRLGKVLPLLRAPQQKFKNLEKTCGQAAAGF